MNFSWTLCCRSLCRPSSCSPRKPSGQSLQRLQKTLSCLGLWYCCLGIATARSSKPFFDLIDDNICDPSLAAACLFWCFSIAVARSFDDDELLSFDWAVGEVEKGGWSANTTSFWDKYEFCGSRLAPNAPATSKFCSSLVENLGYDGEG